MSKKPPKDENQEPFVFEGFEQSNTTPVPDVFFDVLLPLLSSSEVRVMLYIFRRTLGFKKSTDGISFNQFLNGITTKDGKVLDRGCGIKNRTVLSQALASLETKWQCIESRKGDDPAGDKATTIYSVKFKVPGVVSKTYYVAIGGSIKNVPPVVSKTYYGSDKNVPQVVSNPYLQETVIQYTDSQETVIQESTSADSNIANPETDDAHASVLTPSFLSSEENIVVPQLTLPQRDNTQARMDEAEQNLIYMDLPRNVKSEVTYLTEQKYYKVHLKRDSYEGPDMTLFIVTDPHTQEENTYRTETFLKFVNVLRQHSSELKRLIIAREVQNIIDDALVPVQSTRPSIPHPPPLATSIGGVSETTPKHASNSPVSDEVVNHTASSGNTSISGSPSQIEAPVSEVVSGGQSETSKNKQASGVSHSQGTSGNTNQLPGMEKPETPVMPEASMKWGAEKMVQITEALRYVRGKQGAYFSEEVRGKAGKSQRTRQLEAAKKGMALGVTQEEYIRAYVKRNDAWWNENQGSLTVENMFANTPRKQIRILEILEEEESKSAAIAPPRNGQVKDTSSVNPYIARSLDKDRNKKRMDEMRAEIEAKKEREAAAQKYSGK